MTTTFTMRIDDALKSEAEDVFDDIGLNLSSAISHHVFPQEMRVHGGDAVPACEAEENAARTYS